MYSPDFIYDISVARCAREFLSGELSLETFAGKYTQGLTELYSEVELQEIQEPAERLLQFLSEIEAGEGAVDLLDAFIHFRLFFEGIGRPRKMKPLFGVLDDAVKVKVWSPDGVVKAFRAYTFGLRSNTAPKMPAGWELEYTEYTPKFMTLVEKKMSVLDIL